jgi:hypothetical protein
MDDEFDYHRTPRVGPRLLGVLLVLGLIIGALGLLVLRLL